MYTLPLSHEAQKYINIFFLYTYLFIFLSLIFLRLSISAQRKLMALYIYNI